MSSIVREAVVYDWPILMDPETAGHYTGTSKRWLRDRRLADMERLRAGQDIEGPLWVRLSASAVRYRKSDLDRWVETRSALDAVA